MAESDEKRKQEVNELANLTWELRTASESELPPLIQKGLRLVLEIAPLQETEFQYYADILCQISTLRKNGKFALLEPETQEKVDALEQTVKSVSLPPKPSGIKVPGRGEEIKFFFLSALFLGLSAYAFLSGWAQSHEEGITYLFIAESVISGMVIGYVEGIVIADSCCAGFLIGGFAASLIACLALRFIPTYIWMVVCAEPALLGLFFFILMLNAMRTRLHMKKLLKRRNNYVKRHAAEWAKAEQEEMERKKAEWVKLKPELEAKVQHCEALRDITHQMVNDNSTVLMGYADFDTIADGNVHILLAQAEHKGLIERLDQRYG